MKKFKFIKSSKTKGFSLMETLVTLALFGMLSIMLSNIIISMSKFSYENDIRNDVVNELDNAASKLKNNLKSSSIGTCTTSSGKLFLTKSEQGVNFILVQDSENRLVWSKKNLVQCRATSDSFDEFMTSKSILQVLDFKVSGATDEKSTDSNKLIYVYIAACDTGNRVYNCDTSSGKIATPYEYYFAISSRVD